VVALLQPERKASAGALASSLACLGTVSTPTAWPSKAANQAQLLTTRILGTLPDSSKSLVFHRGATYKETELPKSESRADTAMLRGLTPKTRCR
jgi:hypothetical protein